MNDKNKKRTLTISQLKISDDLTVPYIRLIGEYLRMAGFIPGTKITVNIKSRRIVITPEVTP